MQPCYRLVAMLLVPLAIATTGCGRQAPGALSGGDFVELTRLADELDEQGAGLGLEVAVPAGQPWRMGRVSLVPADAGEAAPAPRTFRLGPAGDAVRVVFNGLRADRAYAVRVTTWDASDVAGEPAATGEVAAFTLLPGANLRRIALTPGPAAGTLAIALSTP